MSCDDTRASNVVDCPGFSRFHNKTFDLRGPDAKCVFYQRRRQSALRRLDEQAAALIASAVYLFEGFHPRQNYQDDSGRSNSREIKTTANRKANRGYSPNARCSREPLNDFAARQDRAGAKEANAGYHLCGDARGIQNDVRSKYCGESVRRYNHKQAGPNAN